VERLLEATDGLVDGRLPEGDDDGWRAKIMRAFVLALHDSMLRIAEAQTLRRDRIGPDGRVELSARETKSKRRRTVYLTPRTMQAIADLPSDALNPFVFADRDPPHALAKDQGGGPRPIHERRLHYWFREVCELAGVDVKAAPGDKQIRPQDLRASGATTADENGARSTAIQDAMGHKFLATTSVYLRSDKASNALSVTKVIASVTELPKKGPLRAPRRPPKRKSLRT
jgi:integrase